MEIYYVTIYITRSRLENLQLGWNHLRAKSATEVGVGSDRDPTPRELGEILCIKVTDMYDKNYPVKFEKSAVNVLHNYMVPYLCYQSLDS